MGRSDVVLYPILTAINPVTNEQDNLKSNLKRPVSPGFDQIKHNYSTNDDNNYRTKDFKKVDFKIF